MYGCEFVCVYVYLVWQMLISCSLPQRLHTHTHIHKQKYIYIYLSLQTYHFLHLHTYTFIYITPNRYALVYVAGQACFDQYRALLVPMLSQAQALLANIRLDIKITQKWNLPKIKFYESGHYDFLGSCFIWGFHKSLKGLHHIICSILNGSGCQCYVAFSSLCANKLVCLCL